MYQNNLLDVKQLIIQLGLFQKKMGGSQAGANLK